MLKKLENLFVNHLDPTIMILGMIGNGNNGVKEIIPGVYEIGHFSFDILLSSNGIDVEEYWQPKNNHLDDNWFNSYGVCDDYTQILAKYPFLEEDKENEFVISVTPIIKANQPENGGWRWHKWGPYIGTKNHQHEYIYDEDDSIEKVYCYHIYRIK